MPSNLTSAFWFLFAFCWPTTLLCQVQVRPPSYAPVVELSAFGAVGQGGDDTDVIQEALYLAASWRTTLEIPSQTKPYNVRPLFIPNNSSIIVDADVVIQAMPGYSEFQRLLNINDVANVTIRGTQGRSVFRMLKAEYTSGEYRHCLAITGSDNIAVSGIECDDSGGDGLYIGPGSQGYSSNVSVTDSAFNNNRRQGFSLISGRHILISNCQFSHTSGTEPSDGVDIEPNRPTDSLQDVVIEQCRAFGNAGNGITFGLSKLNSNSLPVSIAVTKFISDHNKESGFFAANGTDDGAPIVSGSIVVSDSSSSMDGKYGAVASYWDAGGVSLSFQRLTVIDPNQSRTNIDNAAIGVKRGGGDRSYMGNVHFERTSIVDNTGHIDVYFTIWDWSHIGIRQLQFLDSGRLAGARCPYGLFEGKPTSSVDISDGK